jgi:hypothetical protein
VNVSRIAGIADPCLEPIEDDELDLARPGGRHPRAGVDVKRGGDEIPEGTRKRARRRDEGKVTRMGEPAHRAKHIVGQLLEQL